MVYSLIWESTEKIIIPVNHKNLLGSLLMKENWFYMFLTLKKKLENQSTIYIKIIIGDEKSLVRCAG